MCVVCVYKDCNIKMAYRQTNFQFVDWVETNFNLWTLYLHVNTIYFSEMVFYLWNIALTPLLLPFSFVREDWKKPKFFTFHKINPIPIKHSSVLCCGYIKLYYVVCNRNYHFLSKHSNQQLINGFYGKCKIPTSES